MPREQNTHQKRSGVRKRAPNACVRCRQQKIRCSGVVPCEQCTKRSLACHFDDQAQKILVSRGFINELERRAQGLGDQQRRPEGVQFYGTAENIDGSSNIDESGDDDDDSNVGDNQSDQRQHGNNDTSLVETEPNSRVGTATPTQNRFTNPFSSHIPNYIADLSGVPWYLGISSNWAFNRRVVSMAHERVLGVPLPTKNMAFESSLYDLNWIGVRDNCAPDATILPSADYAIYLINAVKFHCGQMFHLFDEDSFMRQFYDFHNSQQDLSKSQNLWYIHYLLVLAFGKAFVVRGNASRTPTGAEFFAEAMRLLPNVLYLYKTPVESIEVLCCAALYLQCLDFRSPAHNLIGQALRLALYQGMHTNMQFEGLDSNFVQRCRSAWWTVYVLDRQMSSLMGVPIAISDEDVSASLPTLPGLLQKSQALDLHVKLSRIIAQILNTVYGTDGQLNRRFIASTKAALRAIASVTDELKTLFPMPNTDNKAGISRLSAYLHLLHHQCVVLATRPLLFSFLKMRLDKLDTVPAPLTASSSGSAKVLLQMCIESSQQILNILSTLKAQSLLESFLPFDLEACVGASMILLIAPAIDVSLLESNIPWTDTAYSVLDEMSFHGNLIAVARKAELQLLEGILNQMPFSFSQIQPDPGNHILNSNVVPNNEQANINGLAMMQQNMNHLQAVNTFMDDASWNHEFTADQLLSLADTLELEGIDWTLTCSSGNGD